MGEDSKMSMTSSTCRLEGRTGMRWLQEPELFGFR